MEEGGVADFFGNVKASEVCYRQNQVLQEMLYHKSCIENIVSKMHLQSILHLAIFRRWICKQWLEANSLSQMGHRTVGLVSPRAFLTGQWSFW